MIDAVKSWLSRRGWALVRLGEPRATYGRVLPGADYRPWLRDDAFQAVYQTAKTATLVDQYRCWELWTLIQQLPALAEGAILEVGVWRGGTGAVMARAAQRAGIIEPIILCDTFTGVVKTGAHDAYYRGGEHADTSRAQVERLFASLALPATILSGIFPDDTADQLGDRRVRFVHIDVDAYQSAKDIVAWAWPRMVSGGCLVFDDFGFKVCPGIAQLVHELRGEDRLILHNLNGHAVIVKR